MAKHRTLEPVTYVADGVVVSVDADREIDLNEVQAQSLAGRVVLVESPVDSMFPDGAPIIAPSIVRTVPATPVAGTPVDAPEPAPKPVSKPGKPESK